MIQVRFDPASSEQLVMSVDPPAPHVEGDPALASNLLFAILAPKAPPAGQSTQPSPESR